MNPDEKEIAHEDRSLLADLDATWEAVIHFFERFNDTDWARAHGADWIFADVPYHLTVYNRLIANTILLGENSHTEDAPAIINLAQLNQWNQTQLGAIRSHSVSAEGFARLRESIEIARAVIANVMNTPNGLDTPVWLMTLRVRGWRTVRLALEYLQWHHWLHLAEAGLRYDGKHPSLAPAAIRRALDFNLELTAGAVDPMKAAKILDDKVFRWSLELKLPESGTTAWTLVIDPAHHIRQIHALHHDIEHESEIVEILPEWTDDADVTMRTDLATYLKLAQFNMISSAVAVLTGKLHVKGIGNVNRLTQLFNPPLDQTWTPMVRGRAIKP